MTKDNQANKKLRREFYHWVLEQLTANINEYKDGVDVRVNDESRWLVPVVSHVITDWPEGQAMALCKAGATNCYRNCRVCYWRTQDFADTVGAGLFAHARVYSHLLIVTHF